MKRRFPNSFRLVAIVVTGALLRFWNLDLKPLWLDETITALFSLGHTYTEITLGEAQPLGELLSIFQWQPASCASIASAIRAQSTHPPLFFCWLHQWLGWIDGFDVSLAWKLRSLPAVLGVFAIPAIYRLNRVAFSPSAGLAAALMMSVSPFAVYLSQEARHYTLPMLLITLSLVGLVLMLQDLCECQAIHPGIWIGWTLLNGVGLYTHYFFGLVVAAQVLTILGLTRLYRGRLPQRVWGVIGLAIAGIILIDLPLLPQVLEHLQQPATDWLKLGSGFEVLMPLPRLLVGLIIMTVMFPVEEQSVGLTIGSGLLMLSFAGYLGWRIMRGLTRLWRNAETHLSLLILSNVLIWMLIQYLLVIYGLGKDLTLAFRYNFMLYPVVCALMSAALMAPPAMEWGHRVDVQVHARGVQRDLPITAIVGLLSSLCVLSGLAFLKPFQPELIVKRLQSTPATLVVQTYDNWQTVAFGLSVAVNFKTDQGHRVSWLFQAPQALEIPMTVNTSIQSPLNSLWLFSRFSAKEQLPQQLTIEPQQPPNPLIICHSLGQAHRAMNIKYQPYRCPH